MLLKNTLTDWLSYLETLHPKAIDLGLERVREVANELKLLPIKNFVITVGGTNGKGSCVALLQQILTAANYRVGTYTSPHLLKYNERTRINGLEIDDDELCQAFQKIEQARKKISLTYFEFGTLAVLLLFKAADLDCIILEVGMGGRLDAVNIVDADLAIISSISLDHMEWLGYDLEAIGFEKAGIMRNGKPVVCGDLNTPKSIREHAKKIGAKLFCQTEDFGISSFADDSSSNQHTWSYWDKHQQLNKLPIPKILLQNAATVLQAINLLPAHFKITAETIKQSLAKVFVQGRFQVFDRQTQIIVDVAHNPASGKVFAQQLQLLAKKNRTIAVIAMLNDKDQHGTVSYFLPFVDYWFVGGLEIPRGGSSAKLAEVLRSAQAKMVEECSTVEKAFQTALALADIHDRIIVFGSFYTVASVLKMMGD